MPKEAHVYNGGIPREKLQELLRWERNGGVKERYVKFKMRVWRSKKGVTAHLVVDVMIKVAGVRGKGDRRCKLFREAEKAVREVRQPGAMTRRSNIFQQTPHSKIAEKEQINTQNNKEENWNEYRNKAGRKEEKGGGKE